MIRIGSESARRTDVARLLRSGASVAALCVMSAAAPAIAQDSGTTAASAQDATAQAPDDQDKSQIVVTGIRNSLANSQNIKKNSDTVVDAITAQDIGALPDRSVTEALQRVPGVAMNRFAGSNDPDHFSVEGSGVVIRGLSFVRSEFNGRDTFSTGVYGQAINFSDVPAELLGSVEVYKNLTAEMIEGGLSGTVNLNTRLPFQNKGFHVSFDAEANIGDMEKKWAPTGSFMISNTWDTDIGRFGVLADLSYSRLYSRSDGISVSNYQTRDNALAVQSNTASTLICRNPAPTSTDTRTLPPSGSACGTGSGAGADGLADNASLLYTPLGGQFRSQDYDRQRRGIELAAQWESNDRRALVTAQFLRSDSTSAWGEHTLEAGPDLSEYNTYPAGCHQNGNGPSSSVRAECRIDGSGNFYFNGNDRGNGFGSTNAVTYPNYSYDANGVFESGYITLPGSGWREAASGSATSRVPTGGMQQSLSRRMVDDENIVDDYGLNFKFNPDDHWQINLDAQYVQAQHDTLDVSVFGSNFADQELDLTGKYPVLINHKPLTLSATWAAPNPALKAATDQQYFTDRQWEFWRAAMDHIEHSTGEEVAFKGDFAYNFNDGSFLKRVKFGARYADRDQAIKYTTYNWGAISEVWSGTNQPLSSAVYMDQAGTAQTSFYNFPNFFRGETPGPIGGFYYNGNLTDNYHSASELFKSLNDIWHLRGATATNRWLPLAERPGTVGGTDFLPSEIQHVSERNAEGYLMVSFGSDDPIFGSVRLDGNIGVRVANTHVDSVGAFTIPTQANLGIQDPYTRPDPLNPGQFNGRCDPTIPPPPAPQVLTPRGGICNLGAAAYAQLQTFANGANFPNTAVNNYTYFLPNLNLKFSVTDNFLIRFAASRAMARPALSDIRNFVTIGTNPNDPSRLQATAGNPFLRPAISDQFDLTAEWYFARVGSLTFDAFYKNIQHFFYQAITPRVIVNNGITEQIDIRGPANYTGSGKVKGFEVAYQQTFDFLPSVFNGLGVSASYTFIDSQGLPNSRLNGGAPVNNAPTGVATNLPLEQLSKHNINIAGFYEKGPVSLRLAYNWRSRFLLTSADVIFPYFPIYNEATGTLDGSVFFSLTKQVKVGVQAQNLTNEVVKTLQQFTTSGLVGPRQYFMADRRFSLIVRGTF